MHLADIAAPARMRRLGLAWFVLPVVLVGVWLAAVPHHREALRPMPVTGLAAQR